MLQLFQQDISQKQDTFHQNHNRRLPYEHDNPRFEPLPAIVTDFATSTSEAASRYFLCNLTHHHRYCHTDT